MNLQPVGSRVRFAAGSFDVTPLRNASPLWLRRLAFVGPILACTAGATWLASKATTGLEGPLRPVLLIVAALNLFYMALTGWPAVLGFILHLCRRTVRVAAAPSGESSTALLMPVYNEDPEQVFAAMEAMGRQIAEAGLKRVDLFVLSDTQDGAIAAAEGVAFEQLRARMPAGVTLRYRRRVGNAGRKVGNVLDFCRSWGHAYDYMLVLDADSLMGPAAIGTLIGLMDANPQTGIIQTVPYAVGRETIFARMLQFSARLYTPLLVEGLAFWQQGDANYWGHNAIIRIAPFEEHCTLPVLPGREPFGGEILCHDVVEAGLMRGAGWDVWVLPEPMESFEALPANMVDFASRERRWCQGNLQHIGVLPDRRLRPVGRFHLAYGVLTYLSGPVAVLFFMLATLDAALGGQIASRLMLGQNAASLGLIGLTAAMLYSCKLTTLAAVLASARHSRQFGGRMRLLASAALEQVGALVITGVLIVAYTRYVWELVRGVTVGWDAQPRDDRGLSWREAGTRLWLPTVAGLVWLCVLACIDARLMLWASPLLFGLLAAAPASVLSSRAPLGRMARRIGLFLTPEETAPAPVLRAFQRLTSASAVPERMRAAGLPLVSKMADGT